MNFTKDFFKKQFFLLKENNKRKIYLFLVVLVVSYLVYRVFFSSAASSIVLSTDTVKLGNIEKSIKVVGSAKLVDEQKLRFNQQGEVTKVYYKAGASVKKGDIIAELDHSEPDNLIKQAEISLYTAQLNLKQILDGNTESQVLQAKNNVSSAQSKLDISQKQYDTLLQQQSIAIKQQSGTLDTAISSSRKYLNDAKVMLDNIDVVFGLTDANKSKNDDYEIYISAKNSTFRNNAETSRYSSNKSLADAFTMYGNVIGKNSLDQNEVIKLINIIKITYENLLKTASFSIEAVDSSIANVDFTDSQIESTKNSMISIRSQSQNGFDSLENISNNLESQYLFSGDSSNINILSTTQLIDRKNKENEIQNYKDQLLLAQETLKEIEQGSTEEKIAIAKNDLLKQQLNLENSKKSLDNYKIEAPFDGFVRKVDFKVGDKILSNEEKYAYLENPNIVQMIVLLDQIDVVSVSVGQDVRIVLDSYPDLTLTGEVLNIDTTAQTSAGVVSYEATISFDKQDLKIFGGMTAKMYIVVENKQNILTIPTVYIEGQGERSFVKIKEKNGNIIKQKIEIGLSDAVKTEIISGLSEGDIVIKETISTVSAKKTPSIADFGNPSKRAGGSAGSARSSAGGAGPGM